MKGTILKYGQSDSVCNIRTWGGKWKFNLQTIIHHTRVMLETTLTSWHLNTIYHIYIHTIQEEHGGF